MALFLGFMFGILTASFWQVTFWCLVGLGGLGVIGLVIGRCWKSVRPTPRRMVWVGLFLLAFVFGVLRFQLFDRNRQDIVLASLVSKSISGIGIVVGEPDRRDNSLRLILSIKTVEGKPSHVYKNKVVAVTNPYADIKYGDEVTFKGQLIKPSNFSTDSGRVFNYVRFLEKDSIFFQLNLSKLEVVGHNKGEWLQTILLNLKYTFLNKLALLIPEPELSLLGGLFLGTKQSLGSILLTKFQTAGVIHMVVISGYNITIVADAMIALFSFLTLSVKLCFAGVGVILFVLMTGASAASVRAAIMALVALFSKLIGRKYNVTRALLFAAFVMVLNNPLILVFDPSFQLSFMATLALLVVSPVLAPYFVSWPTWFGLRETLVATLSTQLFLLPFLLYLTGSLSIVALPVNLIVLFPVPFTMLMGFVSGVLAFFSTALATPFAFVTYAILYYVLFIVETAANLWFAAVSFPVFSFWIVIVFYLFLAILLWKLHHRKHILVPEIVEKK